jgi:NAD-dependent deacetylase
MKKHIVFLTGAGMSAESGISTFRDSNGLWENQAIENVATPEGFKKNPALVLEFYNARRKQLFEVKPNSGHQLIAELEKDYKVSVVTQNVDDLHERAGNSEVWHLHGELRKVRSTLYPDLIYNWEKDLNLGDKCEKGSQLRPHIVWFGE